MNNIFRKVTGRDVDDELMFKEGGKMEEVRNSDREKGVNNKKRRRKKE